MRRWRRRQLSSAKSDRERAPAAKAGARRATRDSAQGRFALQVPFSCGRYANADKLLHDVWLLGKLAHYNREAFFTLLTARTSVIH